jgi:hypothetical protein
VKRMKKGRALGKILPFRPPFRYFPGGRLYYDGQYENCNVLLNSVYPPDQAPRLGKLCFQAKKRGVTEGRWWGGEGKWWNIFAGQRIASPWSIRTQSGEY